MIKPTYNRYYRRFYSWGRQPYARMSGLAALTIFTVAFFCFFAILPTFKTIAQLKKQIQDYQTINNQLAKKAQALNTAQANYEKIIDQLTLLSRVLPSTESFETLSWQISWLANQTGVELTNGSFGSFPLKGSAGSELSEIAIDLNLNAGYLATKNFIDQITQLDRLITIQNISLGNKNSSSLKSGNQLNTTLKLTAAYLPQKDQL